MDSLSVFTKRALRIRRTHGLFCLCLVFFLGITPEVSAESEKVRAMVLWVRGDIHRVEPSRQEAEPPSPVEVFDEFRDQQEISLEPGSVLHYLLDERFVIEESRPGRYVLSSQGLTPVKAESPTASGERQLLVAGNWCVGRSVQGKRLHWSHHTRSLPKGKASEVFSLKEPFETLVLDKRPRFLWQVGGDAKRVDLQLWRLENGGELRLLEEWKNLGGDAQRPIRDLSETHFHAIRLQESETMVLQSTESPGEKVVDERREVLVWFKVFPARRQQPLQQAIDVFSSLVQRHPWAGPALMVLEGQCLQREGLLAKAQRHWAELLELHGMSKGVASRVEQLESRHLDEPREMLKPILPFGMRMPETTEHDVVSDKSPPTSPNADTLD